MSSKSHFELGRTTTESFLKSLHHHAAFSGAFHGHRKEDEKDRKEEGERNPTRATSDFVSFPSPVSRSFETAAATQGPKKILPITPGKKKKNVFSRSAWDDGKKLTEGYVRPHTACLGAGPAPEGRWFLVRSVLTDPSSNPISVAL